MNEYQFKLLHILEFNSDRKRQSVILEDLYTKKILLLCKGADSILIERLSELSEYIDET